MSTNNEMEVVPKHVARLVDALEQGHVVMGGRAAGKTWATRIAAAKPVEERLIFQRADPAALALFDPSTKECDMQCGPSSLDPRSKVERLFLCTDCIAHLPHSGSDC